MQTVAQKDRSFRLKGRIKMKRILSLLLVTVMILSLVACGGKTESEASGGEVVIANETNSDSEEVEINIFQFKVEIVDALNHAVAEYTAQNPNVKINIQTVGGGDDYGAALRAQFQSGNEPDVFNVGGPQDVKDWMKKLEDLTDAPWKELPLDGVLSGVTVDGKIYALPYNIEGYGLAYNKAIFKAAGIDASSITSYEAMENAFATIKAKIDSGELKKEFPLLEAPVEYAARETWVTGLHSSNMAFSNEFSSSIEAFDAAKIEFKHSDAFKAYLDLQAKYSKHANKPSGLNSVDYATQVDEGIAIERVAVIQQGNWIYGGVKAIDERVAENLGFLPMPLKGVREDSIAIGVPMYWAVNKDSSEAKKAVAIDFLNWLYTSDAGKNIVVNEMYFIPPMKGYDDVQPSDPLAKDILKFAEEGRTMPWVFMGYPSDWGMGVLGEQIQKYYAGEIEWDKLVEVVKDKWVEMR